MWVGEFEVSPDIQQEIRQTDGRMFLTAQIEVAKSSPGFAELPETVPAILVLSKGSAEAYQVDPKVFSRFAIRREPFLDRGEDRYFRIAEGRIDVLAYLRVEASGQIKVQGEAPDQWLPIDFSRQRLGLAIVTGKEGKNSSRRFWAKAFVFNPPQS